MIISKYLVMIPLVLVSSILICFSIYFMYKRLMFKHKGKEVDVKVMKVVPSGNQFLTYVAFYYQDKLIEKEITLNKKLEEGKTYKGIYVDSVGMDNLMVDGLGFKSSLGAELILFMIGLFFLLCILQEFISIPNVVLYVYLGILLIVIFSFVFMKNRKNKRN